MIIKREELDRQLSKDRLLLFGRRKTGKTFYTTLVKKEWDYAIVRSKNEVLLSDTVMDMQAFLKFAQRSDMLIIDEFHRADEILFDYIQAQRMPEKLILITSTMHFFRKLPHYAKIFGILPELRVGLVSPIDIIKSTDPQTHSFESIIFWQEPTQIGLGLEDIVKTSKIFVQELVGEVLLEEDVAIHEKLKGLLLATSGTTSKLSSIAGKMAKKGFIDRADTGRVTPYLSLAVKLGLIERVPIWGQKRHLYRHASPLTDLLYYLDDRYAYFERELPMRFVMKVVRARMSFYVERFVERFFSEMYGLIPAKSLNPEVDVLLLEYKRPKIAVEVKWKDKISAQELREVENKLITFEDAKKILFVKNKEGVPETDLNVMDPLDLYKLARAAPSVRV